MSLTLTCFMEGNKIIMKIEYFLGIKPLSLSELLESLLLLVSDLLTDDETQLSGDFQ